MVRGKHKLNYQIARMVRAFRRLAVVLGIAGIVALATALVTDVQIALWAAFGLLVAATTFASLAILAANSRGRINIHVGANGIDLEARVQQWRELRRPQVEPPVDRQ